MRRTAQFPLTLVGKCENRLYGTYCTVVFTLCYMYHTEWVAIPIKIKEVEFTGAGNRDCRNILPSQLLQPTDSWALW